MGCNVTEVLCEKIISKVSREDRLNQLAEECAELGHAALKLSRYLKGDNPIGCVDENTRDKLEQNLFQEVVDVLICAQVTVHGDPESKYDIKDELVLAHKKLTRWINRLKEKEKADNDA